MASDHESALPIYSKEEARAIFQRSVKDGSVIFTKESRKRMRERHFRADGDNEDTNDLLKLAHTGIVAKEPEPHIKTGALIYRMESQKTTAQASFEIIDVKRIRLLTVMKD